VVVARIMEGLAAEAPNHKTVSIDLSYATAHRTAASLSVKKCNMDVSQGVLRAACMLELTQWGD
jgi:hypothetical protein